MIKEASRIACPGEWLRAGSVLVLDNGTEITTDAVVVATGRTPRTEGLGFENAGLQLGEDGEVLIDEHCRAAENVWAISDVTEIMPFTHVAMYQGRIAADVILGGSRKARYDGIPRVVFADPEIAAAELTERQANDHGIRTVATELNLAKAITREVTVSENVSIPRHLHKRSMSAFHVLTHVLPTL